MYNYLIALCVFLPYLLSCSSKKEYQYAEVIKFEEESGETDQMVQFKPVKAATDSAAYLEAYKMYCISAKLKKGMFNSKGKVYLTVLEFDVYSDAGKEITDIVFIDKERRKKEIADQVSLMSNDQLIEHEKDSDKNLRRVINLKKSLPPPRVPPPGL